MNDSRPVATWRMLHRPDRLMLRAGIVLTLGLLLMALMSLVWTPHALTRVDVATRLGDPSLRHPFGTDAIGRDVLSLTMRAALTSYVVAAVATAVAFFGGTALGLLASTSGAASRLLAGGTIRFVTALPALGLAAALALRLGPGAVNAMLAIGFAAMPLFVRLAHDAARQVRADGAVAAARLAGASLGEAWWLHAAPRLVRQLAIGGTATMALAVPLEAALAYMGVGAQAGSASLGLMLRDAQNYLSFAPHLALAPGAVLGLIGIGLMLVSDGLRRQGQPHEDDDAAA